MSDPTPPDKPERRPSLSERIGTRGRETKKPAPPPPSEPQNEPVAPARDSSLAGAAGSPPPPLPPPGPAAPPRMRDLDAEIEAELEAALAGMDEKSLLGKGEPRRGAASQR